MAAATLARRNARRQRDASPGERIGEAAGERREHRDVQPRDADQVRDAGAVEHAPLRLRHRALLADRERDDDAGVGCVRQRRENPPANAGARPLHVIRCAPGEDVDPRIPTAVAHVAGGPQPALEHPRLDIEAVRIDGTVRTLQPDHEAPALAGGDFGRRVAGTLAPPLRIPGQRQPFGDDRSRGFDALDGQGEARAARRGLRQIVDDADERDVHTLPCGRQRIGEPRVRSPGGIPEAQRPRRKRRKHGDRDV